MANNEIPNDLMDAVVEEKPANVPAATAIPPSAPNKPIYDTSGLHLQNVSLPSTGAGKEPLGESYEGVPVTKGTKTFGDVVDRYRRMAEVATSAGNADVAKMATERGGELSDELKTVEQFSTPVALATSMGGGVLSKLGKVGKAVGTGAGAYFTGTGIKEASTPQQEGEDEATAMQRRLSGGAQAAFGLHGTIGSVKEFKSPPKFEPEKGYQGLLKSFSSTDPEFKTHIDRLSDRGHLTEIAKTLPKNFIEANHQLRDYMDKWEKTTIDPAIERHDPNSKQYVGTPGFVKGDNISRTLSELKDPQLDVFFPGTDAYIAEEQGKFVGKQIPLSTARELLTKLNSYSAALEDMSPEDANAAKNKSVAKEALDATTDAVRNELYAELGKLGEKGIREGQKDYGAMKELKKNIYNNIPKAEKSHAERPSYSGIPFRSITRHPMITGGMVLGAEALHNPAPLAALPAIEALKTYNDRANTPNETLKKSYKNFRGGPQVARPSFVPPPASQQQLPTVTPLAPSSNALPAVPPPPQTPTQATMRLTSTGEAIPSVAPFERVASTPKQIQEQLSPTTQPTIKPEPTQVEVQKQVAPEVKAKESIEELKKKLKKKTKEN